MPAFLFSAFNIPTLYFWAFLSNCLTYRRIYAKMSTNESRVWITGLTIFSYRFLPARRYSDTRVIAIIVSVCLCVTRRYCIKTAKRRITQTTPRNSPGTVVYWRQNLLVDDTHPSPEICAESDPPPFQAAQFRPIFAHSASTVRAGEKV